MREPSPALDRLLALAAGRPLALAVIPDGDRGALSARLKSATDVIVGQHGVDHVNRRGAGAPPSEYAETVSASAMAALILVHRERLEAAGLAPAFFTPPWNAIQPDLVEALRLSGFETLSAGEDSVDVLRWKGGPRFKGSRAVLRALRRKLADRRRAGAFHRPVGLLTHHLEHDEATWRFLNRLVPWLDGTVEWVPLG